MHTIKKRLSIILIIVACFSFITFNTYGTTDYNDMALVLNKLSILQGSNGDFQLDSTLNRAQATAFIIRMIGKEKYVLQNSEKFAYTSFTDVPADSWYAPYVGYGTQNSIIASSSSGKFDPFEKISEKAFLKMALCALGYVYGEDFNWSNVYQKAYEIGLVIDPSYAVKIDDNFTFKRSSAVEIIYRSLNTFKKGTSVKLAMSFVDEGVFSAQEVYNSGIFKDETVTAIETITALAPNSIEVQLNEQIQKVARENIMIYDNSDANSILDVVSVAVIGSKIQISTAGQTPGKQYRIEINGLTDMNGNLCGNLIGVFAGYKAEQVASDFFRVSKVEQISGNLINIYYTHPVNMNSEIPVYYEIFENGIIFVSGSSSNMSIKRLNNADNVVSLNLRNTSFKPDAVYSLRVSGKLTSNYGAKLGEGLGDVRDFLASGVNSEPLGVSSVQALTGNTVKVTFNREVDPVWAAQRLNYSVLDPYGNAIDTVGAVVGSGSEANGREVLVSLSGIMDRSKKYTIRIAYIPDIYKQSIIENYETVFSGEYPLNRELAFVKVAAEQNNCLTLWFNKSLDPASAVEKTNYVISGVSDSSFNLMPDKVFYTESDGNYTVKLYLPAGKSFSQSQRYVIRTSNLKDRLGNINTVLLRSEFTGTNTAAVKPKMDDAVTVAKDLVKVNFNIEIAFSQENLDINNYRLEYTDGGEKITIIPLSVNYINSSSIVLRFDELDPEITYKLSFISITDFSGAIKTTAADANSSITVRWGK